MPRYGILADSNGATFLLTRHADGKTVLLQGDDAIAFDLQLDATHDKWTDDDLCDEYSDLFNQEDT